MEKYYHCLYCKQPVTRSWFESMWGYVHLDGYQECRQTYASAAQTYIGDGKWDFVPIPEDDMKKYRASLY